ncbi:uncharacterized protein LOC109727846 [Ananas comosus]|uniref:Uncharacterized protein LOC109727846 n=1 Tax=Ananas comosus TaxID=4615 RepID=A0A199UII2_ANACO|nr:uncharacterized protein LOC109727846 [Ananas comosus]OAY64380.1 hypothetical protein ACMD2_19717 [Ananas comosus]
MLMSGNVLSARAVPDLLQNCDLPPPLKLFSPVADDEEKKRKPEPGYRVPLGQQRWGDYGELGPDRGGGDNPSLLRALQLSQTRAREAEKQALLARTTNRRMAALLLEESLRLSAHQRWIAMLEIEISMLQRKGLWQKEEDGRDEDAAVAAGAAAAATWCFALALCLGIAGVGFALGRCLC